jgi:cytochrome P450
MAMKGLLGPLSWLLPRAGFDADRRLFKGLLHRTIEERLKSREGEYLHPQSDSPSQSRFLDRLSVHTTDPETLNNDITAALMASESTARPLSHTIWLLSQHPKIYKKLRQSVLDVVGLQEPTYEDLNKFPYLISVLNEGKPT